jgi:hypothetical protein
MRKTWFFSIAAIFFAVAGGYDLVQALPMNPQVSAAAPGADSMAAVRGRAVAGRGYHGRAVAVRGPRGAAVAVRGHRGAVVAARGARGVTVVAGRSYHVGRRYYGGVWYGAGRRFWRGRWWAYGVGSCWRSTPIGYVWVCS